MRALYFAGMCVQYFCDPTLDPEQYHFKFTEPSTCVYDFVVRTSLVCLGNGTL